MNEIVVLKEPHALAGLTARLPSLFLPDEKTAERFLKLFSLWLGTGRREDANSIAYHIRGHVFQLFINIHKLRAPS